MSQPALLAVAHGSRNPGRRRRHRALARQIRRLAPVLDVQVAFIGHAEPSLPDELGAAGVERRHRAAAAVDRLPPDGRHHRRGQLAPGRGSPGRSGPTSCC